MLPRVEIPPCVVIPPWPRLGSGGGLWRYGSADVSRAAGRAAGCPADARRRSGCGLKILGQLDLGKRELDGVAGWRRAVAGLRFIHAIDQRIRFALLKISHRAIKRRIGFDFIEIAQRVIASSQVRADMRVLALQILSRLIEVAQ